MTKLAQEVENPVIDVEDITFEREGNSSRTATQLPVPKGYKLLIALIMADFPLDPTAKRVIGYCFGHLVAQESKFMVKSSA